MASHPSRVAFRVAAEADLCLPVMVTKVVRFVLLAGFAAYLDIRLPRGLARTVRHTT
ncbi:MAG: hypothetical protein GX649_00570 [Chloroflexi bacterium]|nr:hypothetical protein [Chloroflexota bacterium]